MFRLFSNKIILFVIVAVFVGTYHIQADAYEVPVIECQSEGNECEESTPQICRNIKKDKLYNKLPSFILDTDAVIFDNIYEGLECIYHYKKPIFSHIGISHNELARSHI